MMAYIFGPCGKEKVYYDIGFGVERRRGITPIGKVVVRVDGQWVEAQFAGGVMKLGASPVTKPPSPEPDGTARRAAAYFSRMRVPLIFWLLRALRKFGTRRSISSKYEDRAGVFCWAL